MTHEPGGEPRALFDDLFALPVGEAQALANGYVSHSYALLAGDKIILVDTAYDHQKPAIDELVRNGRSVAAVVLTHRHVLGHIEILQWLAHELGAPILLHPLDAERASLNIPGTQFSDPSDAPVLSELGLDVTHFPGHTAGSVLLYWRAHGGVMLTGDSAMGPSLDEDRAGSKMAFRPPRSFNDDDELLRASWAAFDRPAASLLPLHGKPIVDQAAQMPEILTSLRRAAPTTDFLY
ncbi:MAG: MBL fold metallo-hydrolase [Polyangiaceae bacterium]|nr:MBL fold metallo-hydrolase [Polyangiaceae bacterium]